MRGLVIIIILFLSSCSDFSEFGEIESKIFSKKFDKVLINSYDVLIQEFDFKTLDSGNSVFPFPIDGYVSSDSIFMEATALKSLNLKQSEVLFIESFLLDSLSYNLLDKKGTKSSTGRSLNLANYKILYTSDDVVLDSILIKHQDVSFISTNAFNKHKIHYIKDEKNKEIVSYFKKLGLKSNIKKDYTVIE